MGLRSVITLRIDSATAQDGFQVPVSGIIRYVTVWNREVWK